MLKADLEPVARDRKAEGISSILPLFRIKRIRYLLTMKEMESALKKHIAHAHLYDPHGLEYCYLLNY